MVDPGNAAFKSTKEKGILLAYHICPACHVKFGSGLL